MLDSIGSADTKVVVWQGPAPVSKGLLTADASEGDTSVSHAGTDLAEGDLIIIKNSADA